MRRLTASLSVALILSLSSAIAVAQTPQARSQPIDTGSQPADARTQAVIDRAEHLYEMGEQAFAQNDLERSRREFDDAVDAVLTSGMDVRSNAPLKTFYNELVEKIHQQQMLAQDADPSGFAEQAYVPAESELASLTDADLAALSNAPANQTLDGTYNFPFTVDEPVFQFISYFTGGRGRSTMESGLRRSGRYRAMAEQIFKEEGVPTDLIWLAQVESVWKPTALSPAAAKGIWQFIPSTGRRFGLDQDYYVDQRSDPEQATRAAARYLKFLYNYFAGDWLLAMAAYNSGEGNVSRAIARSGYADFWELHRGGFLPNETRNYVPAILAVIIVAHNQKRYGFNVTPEPTMTYDVAQLSTQTDLAIAAQLCGTTEDVIRDLNPHLRRNTTPPGSCMLRIPTGKKKDFETAYAALSPEERLGHQSNPSDGDLADDSSPARDARPAVASGFGGGNSTVSYTARSGETLTSIASRYGVSPVELARVNRISSDAKLQSGQVLRVPSKTNEKYTEQPVRKTTYRAKPERQARSSHKAKPAPAHRRHHR
jgi:membrane-bound lytic murein transglycosylase D